MRTKILIIAVLLLSLMFSGSGMSGMIIQQFTSDAGYNCTTLLGTTEFYWDGEHTTSDTTACSGGGDITGTLSGATIVTAQNHTTDGANSAFIDADYDNLTWAVTTSEFDLDEGTLRVWAYGTPASDTRIVTARGSSSSDMFRIEIRGSGVVRFTHVGSGTTVALSTTATVNDGAWNKVEARWSVASNVISIDINDGGWEDDADGDPVTANGSDPSSFEIGDENYAGHGTDFYVDDLTIDTTYNAF